MTLKQTFAEYVQAQSEIWRAQTKDYQARLGTAGAKARLEYEKGVAEMQSRADEARKLFEQVQSANETAWKDMQSATQKAFEEMQKGWVEALSRFK